MTAIQLCRQPRVQRRVKTGTADRLPDWWEPLFDATGCESFFLSRAWIETWLNLYGGDFDVQWVRWEAEGTVVGGCLIVGRWVRVNGIPLYTLYLNASGQARHRSPLSEFNDVLHDRRYRSAIAADLAQHLNSMSWSRLALSGYLEQGVIPELVGQLDFRHQDRVSSPAPYIDLRALPDAPFQEGLSGRKGYHSRRNRRIYEERFGKAVLSRPRSLSEALDYFAELVRLNRLRWNRSGKRTSFADPVVVSFHEQLIRRLWGTDTIDLVRVGSALKPAGFLYNFALRSKISFFQSGFDYGHDSRLSPGLLTLVTAVEAYRHAGRYEFDFLAGDAHYKRTLSNAHRELHWLICYRDRRWIDALLLLRTLKRRLRGEPDPPSLLPT